MNKNKLKTNTMLLLNYCQNYIYCTEEKNYNNHIYEYSWLYIHGISTKQQDKELKKHFKL